MSVTKSDLVDLMSQKTQLTKKASKEFIDTFLDEVTKALKRGEKVKLSGFGVFFTKLFKSKMVKPIGGGEKQKIPPRRMPRFRPGTQLKDAVE